MAVVTADADRDDSGEDGGHRHHHLDLRAAFARHYGEAHRWATAFTGDPHVADDVVQDAFVKIFSRVRPLRSDDAFAGYLRRTIVNTAISRHRSLTRERARAERVAKLDGRPVVEGVGAELDPELWQAVERLAPRQRAVVILRYWFDLPEAEIASVLQCRVGTVKSAASRALSALRTELGTELRTELGDG